MNLNPFSISGLFLTITSFILILIILIYGKTKLHRLWALFNVAVGIWGFGSFLIGKASTETAALIYWRLANIGIIFIAVFFFHVICVFCEISRPKVIIAAYVQAFFFLLLNATNLLISRIHFAFNSFYYIQANNLYLILFSIWISIVVYGHLELYKFYRKAQGVRRNQALYLLIGMLIGFLGGTTNILPMLGINFYPWGNFTIPLYSIIATYAILRHHLMDITVVIKKTLVYSILVSIITVIYFVIIYLFERFFCVMMGYRSIFAAAAILAAFSIIFIPLKNKIQRSIDRLFFKGTIDQIEKEKVMLETELERSERLKSVATLAAGMAHEIKNPLTSIKTFVEYMDTKYKDPEFREKFERIVPKEIDKITSIINQLLDYSKTQIKTLKDCSIHSMLDYVADLYNSLFIKKRIRVQRSYNSQSPNITCDENQIKQAFINIIQNSIEAMPNGGEITINTEDIDNVLEVSIKDTGRGIPKEKLKHLFDPFYTTKEKGTGLGLFIVHQIIENNNGRIAIDSDLSRGTIVRVRFG